MPVLCATEGSDTVWYIKKQTAYLMLLSPPERKWMSPHWNWLSFNAKEQYYFTCAFCGYLFSPPILKMHWTALAMYYLKVSSCKNAFSVSETVWGTRYICICVSKFLERQLVCQLTGCYVVTCVRVKVLTVLLTLSSKPLAFLWTPSTLGPLCDHQSLFSPVHST